MSDAIIITLKSLYLFGMGDAINTLLTQAFPVYKEAISLLESVLTAQVAEGEVRSINYQL